MPNSEDYSTWRQSTIGGIRYRYLGSTGRFTADGGRIEWSAIFRASDLLSALAELFPPPTIIGNISYPNPGVMPGLAGFVALEVGFKDQAGNDLPIDPFGQDPSGGYHQYIQLDVTFGPSEKNQPNPNDPRTFLEIQSDVGGEYIYAPATGAKLIDESNANGEDDQIVGLGGPLDEDTLRPRGEVTEETPRDNKHPHLPLTVLVPTTDWTITWRQIPYHTFRNTIVWRLRSLRGRVNAVTVPWLMKAPPETLLMAGFVYKESYTWRNGLVDTPPIDVTIKIIEKHVVWKGVICGHNHVFEPGKGWVRATLEDGSPPHRLLDFNYAFKI